MFRMLPLPVSSSDILTEHLRQPIYKSRAKLSIDIFYTLVNGSLMIAKTMSVIAFAKVKNYSENNEVNRQNF